MFSAFGVYTFAFMIFFELHLQESTMPDCVHFTFVCVCAKLRAQVYM